MPSASPFALNQLLADWTNLLSEWAANGSLETAARDALQLKGEPARLKALISQWAVGDFKELPTVVGVPADRLPMARGAYAGATNTIYLNQAWLSRAPKDEVLAVLTEELGHHLDMVLNTSDTPGDEGELFQALLGGRGVVNSQARLLALSDEDHDRVRLGGQWLAIEKAAAIPVLSFANSVVSRVEGNTGATSFTFIVSRTGNTSGSSGALWQVQGLGTAPATASDFIGNRLPSGTVAFATGQTRRTVTVNVAGDTTFESNETFSIRLSAPTGATLGGTLATGTITNDDSRAVLGFLPPLGLRQAEGNGGSTAFTFVVSRSGNTTGLNSVKWAVSGSGPTAADAADFTGGAFPNGTVSFTAGQTRRTLTVNVAGDRAAESEEAFSVVLSDPSSDATLGSAIATGTIGNDDLPPPPPPSLSITALSANKPEGTGSLPTPYTFSVSRSGNISGLSTALWAVSSTSAANAADFQGGVLPSGTLSFSPGQSSLTLTLNVNADTVVEANESFSVALSSPSGATLGSPASATGTIGNDDLPPPPPPPSNLNPFALPIEPLVVRNTANEIRGQLAASDPEGDPIRYSLINDRIPGFTLQPNGAWQLNPKDPAYGSLIGNQKLTIPILFKVDDQIEPAQPQLPANVLTVGLGTGSFSSIQEALDAAPGGATIWIASGTYTGDLTITKSVTLLGANHGISAAGARKTETTIRGFIDVKESAGSVSIDGFNLAPKQDASWKGSNLRIDAPTSSLRNSIVTSAEANGGFAYSGFVSYAVQRREIEVSNNLFQGILNHRSGPNVIRIFGSDKATIRGNTFMNTGGGGNIGTSHRFDSLTVEDNLIVGGGEGLFYYNQPTWDGEITKLLVRNNTLVDNRRYGISIGEKASVRSAEITGNIITPTSNRTNPADLITDQFINIYVLDGKTSSPNYKITDNLIFNPWNEANRSSGIILNDSNFNTKRESPIGSFSLTIEGSAPPPSLAISPAAANKLEGTSAAPTPFTFAVSRTGDASGVSTALWNVGGTAANAADFWGGVLPSGTVSFAAGETSLTLTLNVTADAGVEADESFTVSLSSPTGATLSTASAIGTILNDDLPSPPPPAAGTWNFSWTSFTPLFDWSTATPLGTPSILKASVAVASPRSGEQPLGVTALRIDLRDPAISLTSTGRAPGWSNNVSETMGQTTRQFITSSRDKGLKIVAAINTAPYEDVDYTTSKPTNIRGFAVSEGQLISSTDYNGDTFKSTFLYDPITGARIQNLPSKITGDLRNVPYAPHPDDLALAATLKVATSGFGIVLADNVPGARDKVTQTARSALGLTSDGRYLTMMTVDRRPGVQQTWQGATDYDVGVLLKGFGSSTGMLVDGGGSTQMAWWNPAVGKAELLNNRFDPFGERYVGSSLGVVYAGQ